MSADNPKVVAMLAAAGEALEEAAIPRIGRDLGTIHRDAIVGATLAAGLRRMADEVDNGPTFPIPPSVVAQLIRERADDLEGAA
jgi:hypothetical protein